VQHGAQLQVRHGQGQQQVEESGEERGQEEIRAGSGKGHEHHVAHGVLEVAGVHGHGLGPADAGQDEGDGAHGVQVAHGVHGQPPGVFGRGVAQGEGGEAVRQFVTGQAQEQGHGQNADADDLVGQRFEHDACG